MARILVLADDMTGANDTGAALHELGYEVLAVNDISQPVDGTEGYDCVSVNLDSRPLDAGTAYRQVQGAAERFSGPDTILFSKRIDSTLRGNLGSECDALLDWRPGDPVCFVAPAFPKAGRIYHNDTLFVAGTELTATPAAADPQCPIRTASVKERFQEQTRRKVCVVPLAAVREGADELICLLRARYLEGTRIILLEADREADIQAAAFAAVHSGLPFVCADPGPFTAAAAHEYVPVGAPSPYVTTSLSGGVILGVVGSINEVSREQLKMLCSREETKLAVLDVQQVLTECRDNAIIETVERAVSQLSGAHTVLLVLSTVLEPPAERLDFEIAAERLGSSAEEVRRLVNDSLAETAERCLQRTSAFGGLFSCGGDTSAALLRRLGVHCMRILGEVIPLAVCAQMAGGRLIVTKGGMAGRPDGMCLCVDYLRDRGLSNN